MTPLSAHFSLEEATVSQTALRKGIPNFPTADVMANMREAALGMEYVRTLLNSSPIHINSWFRCINLNREIGSKDTSDHITGFAIDFTAPNYGDCKAIVKAIIGSKIQFSQVIYEFDSWVHISFRGTKRQALVIDQLGTRPWA